MTALTDEFALIFRAIDAVAFPYQILIVMGFAVFLVLATSLSPSRFVFTRFAIAGAVAAAVIWHGHQFGVMTAILLSLGAVYSYASEMSAQRTEYSVSDGDKKRNDH